MAADGSELRYGTELPELVLSRKKKAVAKSYMVVDEERKVVSLPVESSVMSGIDYQPCVHRKKEALRGIVRSKMENEACNGIILGVVCTRKVM